MTFRYIGSKSRLIDQIKDHIGHPQEDAFLWMPSVEREWWLRLQLT